MANIVLHIRGGTVTTIYDERLDLRALGPMSITRASHVEPDEDGWWWADMGQVRLGPYEFRSQAIAAEVDWLEKHLGKEEYGKRRPSRGVCEGRGQAPQTG